MRTMKSALVIGGNRFIGKRVADRLRQDGVTVTLLNRHGTGDADRIIAGDRSDVAGIAPQIANDRWDAIFDFAAYKPTDCRAAIELFRGKTDRYVIVSSIAVYAMGRDLVEDDFDAKTWEIPNRTLSYAEGKKAVEAVFAREAPFAFVAVRLPYILGSDDYTKRLDYHVECSKSDKEVFVFNRTAAFNMVSSADAADFLCRVARTDHVGPINWASSEPVTYAEFLAILGTVTKKTPRYASKQGGSNNSPYDHATDKYMSLARARGLGFSPTSVYAWLPELVAALAR